MQRQSIPESRLSVRTETDKTPVLDTTVSAPNRPTLGDLLARVDWRKVYDATTLAIIGLCGIAHLITASNSPSLFAAVLPVFGFTACMAYGLVCYASQQGSLLKLLFVAGALTTFWIQ